MKQLMILFLVVVVFLSFITISLESVPVQEYSQHPQKINIFLDIVGEDDLLPLIRKHMLEM